MADVRSVMTNGGDVIMGVAKACGENRASEAIKKALRSPLVEYCDVKSANKVLLLITYGSKFGMSEFEDVTRPLKSLGFSSGGNLIWGMGQSSELNPDELHVTIVAAGVERREQTEESVVKQIYEDEIKVQEPSPNKGKKFIDISKFDDESFIEMMENSRPGTINA
jgi:cell division protein FtsZ